MIAPEKYPRQALGNLGVEFVRSSLTAGRSLSKEAARTVDLDGGTVFTYLPEPPRNLTPQTFRTGGVAGAQVSEEIAIRLVLRQLGGKQDVLIAENPMANCSDSWVRTHSLGVICYLDEVYHLGTRDGVETTGVRGALRVAHSVPDGQVSMVTEWNGEFPTNWPHKLPDVGALAAAVKVILVTAFDGEGYVVWEPQIKPEPMPIR